MKKRIVQYIKTAVAASPFYFCLNFVVLMIFALGDIGASYAMKSVTNSMIFAQENGSISFSLYVPILFFFFMICISGNTSNLNDFVIRLFTAKAEKRFSKILMKKTYEQPHDSFYDTEFNNRHAYAVQNIGCTTELSTIIFNKLLFAVLSICLNSAVIASVSPIVLVYIGLISVILTFSNLYISRKRNKLSRGYIENERKAAYLYSLLTGKENAREMRLTASQKYLSGKWEEAYNSCKEPKFLFEKKAVILSESVSLVQKSFVWVSLILYLYLASIGMVTAGDFVLLNSLMLGIASSMIQLVEIVNSDLASDIYKLKEFDSFISSDQNSVSCPEAKEEITEFRKLTLENVGYRYPNQDRDAVHDVNFTLHKGEIVSILGYNGSGKSTLSKVLCGVLKQYEGKVYINDIEIEKYSEDELNHCFGIAFQDFSKYCLTLRENIGFGRIDKINDRNEIQTAFDKGHLSQLMSRLSDGLDTVIGKEYDSRGTELSGGQWQRIALSRAYMGTPDVLVFDEPTASVDPLEEMRILEHFREIIEDKTAVLISHRIGFARLADRICIMENGTITESGTHRELLNKKGSYYRMFKAQSDLYDETVHD